MTEIEIENRISDLTFLKSVDSELLKLDKYRLELKELNEYKQTHVILIGNCPLCNTSISSCDGKLTLSDGKHFISEKEVSNIEKKISNLISSINYLEDLDLNKKDILNVYKETEVDDKYLSYLKHVKVNDKIWNACNTLICEKPVHDIDVIIRTNQEREAKIAMRNIINETLSKVEDKLNNLDLEDNCIDVYLDKLRDINMDINTTTESIKNFEIRNQWEKVKKLRIAEQDMETKLPRAVKLSALITKAERIALDDTISNINLRTNIYLSRFLPNVIANITFLSEKLDLKITIDEEPTDINSLSGGEFARVVLAFAIAMAEINNVPILMLDESFASLDAETTESVLEAIRENYNGDIIVVAHQTTKGVFDTVIELKKLYMTK
jgi:DNA repair exonuclease SbcCD ATPase subunit